jgi:hypothetical protein
VKAGARFSVVLTKNRTVTRAIARIPGNAWTPVRYPGAVLDPDTGQLISDAEVAEICFTTFATTGHPITARLIVRRVRDRAKTEELFPVWRYHPFFTDSTAPTAEADIIHRQHAVIETTHADLIDGPLAHQPSGYFAANNAWALCAVIAHNLLRCRHAGQPPTRTGSRCHDPSSAGHCPRPVHPATRSSHAASAHALALGLGLGQPLRHRFPRRHPSSEDHLILTVR